MYPGLVHQNCAAQSTLPILRLAGEDMAPSSLSPNQLSRAGTSKPFFGSAMGFHFSLHGQWFLWFIDGLLLRRNDHNQAAPFHAGGILDCAYLCQL